MPRISSGARPSCCRIEPPRRARASVPRRRDPTRSASRARGASARNGLTLERAVRAVVELVGILVRVERRRGPAAAEEAHVLVVRVGLAHGRVDRAVLLAAVLTLEVFVPLHVDDRSSSVPT